MDEKFDRWLMYKEYLKVQPSRISSIGSIGTFSTVQIPANVPIMEIMGPVVLDREIKSTNYDAYLQVGPNTFIGMAGDVGDTISHSCDPNCYVSVVGNRAILFSLYVIPMGAELTFDYSTTSTDTWDTWKMECKCGSYKCRKNISGYQYLDDSIKNLYIKNNMVPLYIIQPSLIHKR